ncbi:MAG TPA: CHC2 zinc finger domain-containing protein [Opitutaceae bacterium]|nr:CHC2 zinc finger domain-containing protein [Opitutaceae bacterium]
MNAAIDFDAIRARNPLPEYCERRGIKLRRSGGSLVGKCPVHHEHHGAAFVVFGDGHWKCFGKCQRSGDVIDLEQALGGGTLADAANRLGAQLILQHLQVPKAGKQELGPIITKENPFGLPYRMSDDERRVCVDCATRLLTTESAIKSIAHQRGWSAHTIRNLALEASLGVTEDGKLGLLYESGLKVRWKENGERRICWSFGKPWIWRLSYINQAKTVYISEGETDGITLIDSGLEEDGETLVAALPSASFYLDRWAPLFAGKKVIIATDSDEAGEVATKRLVAALKKSASSLERLEFKENLHA